MSALPSADLILPGADAPAAQPRPLPLSRRRKAAIVVRFLLAQGQRLPLHGLPQDLQIALTHELAGMRAIDRATLDAVIAEFVAEVERLGLAFPTGIESALDILGGSISDGAAARVRRDAGLALRTDPWERILALAPEDLVPLIEGESIEVAAVILSKLKVAKAAALLGLLPGERARRITYAMSRTGAVTPLAVQRIGEAILSRLDGERVGAFDGAPVDRVGAILNVAPTATREAVLSGLDETDGAFAREVRRTIFTFVHIPARVDARDIPRIVREIDQTALARAIAGAGEAERPAIDFLLANLSQRMAEGLREAAEELQPVTPAEGEAARTAIVGVIRDLEAAGDLVLLSAED
jgi:flagellar motor switch protein FliG